MTATQQLGTGRSAEFSESGGGGASLADVMLGKSFFQSLGILPANTIFENLNAFKPTDYEFGMTHVVEAATAKFTNASPGNAGWNLGASYNKVLIILGMSRIVGFSAGPSIGQVASSDANPPQGYFFVADPSGGCAIFKAPTGGGWSQIANDANLTPPAGGGVGQALYYNKLTNKLTAFLRFGIGQWIKAVDVTDASFAAKAINAGIVTFVTSPYYVGCAMGVYAED